MLWIRTTSRLDKALDEAKIERELGTEYPHFCTLNDVKKLKDAATRTKSLRDLLRGCTVTTDTAVKNKQVSA